MIKPVGARCNLRCSYCYYPEPEDDSGARPPLVSDEILDELFAGYLPAAPDEVVISWQGGEPTLAGIPFFERALALQERHRRPTQSVANAIQTNGTRIDDAWARFLARHGFLVGVSLDGPPRLHDAYRLDRRGHGSRRRVARGLAHLRRRGVAFNLLCVLHDRNVARPVALYESLRAAGTPWLQFVPAVEWSGDDPAVGLPRPAPFSPSPAAYGWFLCDVFDRWFERDRRSVSVRLFDALIYRRVRGTSPYCVFGRACDAQLTIESGGEIYACDHFVSPERRLGRVDGPGWADRVDLEGWRRFAAAKSGLPESCRVCRWRELCRGGCPKHRPPGEAPRPSVLCDAYRRFFEHALGRIDWIAGYLRRGVPPPESSVVEAGDV
jgi:uncharacterized protein